MPNLGLEISVCNTNQILHEKFFKVLIFPPN